MKTVKVYIPNNGYVRPELLQMFPDATCPDFHPIYLNRRSIVQDFLKTDGEYLLMVDHDVVPVHNVLDADIHYDITGFPTPIHTNGMKRWNIYKKPFKDMEYGSLNPMEKGHEEVDVVGTGCILIHRKVLEKIDDFTPVLDGQDIKYGTDFGFCQRAKAAGFTIGVEWNYPCHHYKTVDLLHI